MGNIMARFGNMLNRPVQPDIGDYEQAGAMLAQAIRNVVNPIFIVIGSLGALFAIWLGVRLATAQDESKRKEAKSQLVFALIAVIMIFALVGVFYAVFPAPTVEYYQGATFPY